MGVHNGIDIQCFPRQAEGAFGLNARVTVCFNYDTSQTIGGTIVRSDLDEPGRTIIRLDDGRHILSTECQYSPE